MSIQFGQNLTQISTDWTTFKNYAIGKIKTTVLQYEEENYIYNIFFFDDNIVYTTIIWKLIVPDGVINGGYSQSQNDSDKLDFETNYKTNSNKSLTKLANSGVVGHAPAKGLGGFAPDPHNNPYEPDADEIVSLYADGEGQAMVRGSVLTDEGSFRDDFTANLEIELTGTVTFINGSREVTGVNTLFTEEVNRDFYIKLSGAGEDDWVGITRVPNNTNLLLDEPYLGISGSGTAIASRWTTDYSGSPTGEITTTGSHIQVTAGDGYDSWAWVHRFGDYPPMYAVWKASISQRITDQECFIGFRDDCNEPRMYCDVIFDGTDNTKVKFRSAWDGDEQLTIVNLPAGLNTSMELKYKIDVSIGYCALLINGVLVAQHDEHVPDMYTELNIIFGISNLGATSSTILLVDSVFWSNQNQIQIASSFQAPIPVITREDQHTIFSTLTTSSTSADQIIIEYTVPSGRVMYLIGYRIDASNSVSANPIKIGRNDLNSVPTSPGSIDGNIFRTFNMNAGSSTNEIDFGGNPRKLGVGGDVIKVTVTPSALLSSTWYAALDFVLR